MAPDEEWELRIERFRAMTGEQRVKIACDLTTLSWEIERDGIRREFPDADEAEVERVFRLRRMAFNEEKQKREIETAMRAYQRRDASQRPHSPSPDHQ